MLSDMDGVLVDSYQQHVRVMRRWADRHGLDPGLVINTAHGVRNRDLIAALAPGMALEPELDLIATWADVEAYDVAALPGAAGLLGGTLVAMPLAVVTSTGRKAALTRLSTAGLPIPQVLVSAECVSNGKPHPAPYLHAAELLDVDIAGCLVIEDAPAGVTAGLRAGATVAAIVTTHAEDDLRDAHMIAASVADLAARLL